MDYKPKGSIKTKGLLKNTDERIYHCYGRFSLIVD
jgi:hypothetical protein